MERSRFEGKDGVAWGDERDGKPGRRDEEIGLRLENGAVEVRGRRRVQEGE